MNRRRFLTISTLTTAYLLLDFKKATSAVLEPGAEKTPKTVTIGPGQMTVYSSNKLMDMQVLYHFGIDYNKVLTNKTDLRTLLEAPRVDSMRYLIKNEEFFARMENRMPNPLRFLQRTIDPLRTNRPYFVAPDILDFNQKAGTDFLPEEFIAKRVTIMSKGYYNSVGTWINTPKYLNAYIFDVLANQHRKTGVEDTFFMDTDPHTYGQLGIIWNNGKTPYFLTPEEKPIHSLPYVTVSMDMNQFSY